MYNNPFINTYNPQISIDRINNQIQELEKLKSQIPQQPMQQPTNLTQNFQIAPTNNEMIRYANSIDDVKKVFVLGDTPYFSKDLSILWIKNIKGDIKTYELNEIIQKDEKDLKIETLLNEIDNLKKEIEENEKSTVSNVDEPITNAKPTNGKSISKSNKK